MANYETQTELVEKVVAINREFPRLLRAAVS